MLIKTSKKIYFFLALILFYLLLPSTLAWWNESSYPYAYEILSNATSTLPICVNDTDLVNNTAYWVANTSDKKWVVCENSGCGTGLVAIANETHQKNWQIENSIHLGANRTKVYNKSRYIAVFHIDNKTNFNDSAYYNVSTWSFHDYDYTRMKGVFGDGLYLDSWEDDFSTTDSNLLNLGVSSGKLTISLWFQPITLDNYGMLVSDTSHVILNQQDGANAGKIQFYVLESDSDVIGYQTTATLSTTVWTHVVAVANGTHIFVYMNGQRDTTIPTVYDGTIRAGASNFGIACPDGECGEDNSDPIGYLDEILFLNDSVSDEWVLDYYNMGKYHNLTALGSEESPLIPTKITLYLNGTTSNQEITYGDVSNITATINTTGLHIELTKNSSLINNDTDRVENITDINWFKGNTVYEIEASYPGNSTFGSSSSIHYITVNRASTTATLTLTPSSPIIYETQTKAICSATNPEGEKATLYRNGTNVTTYNNTNVYLPAGAWNYTCNISTIGNYSSASDSSIYTVSKKNASVRVFPETDTVSSGTSVTQYCIDNSTLLDCNIYRDNVAITNNTNATLSGGSYVYKANITDKVNYTEFNDTETLTIMGFTNCSNGGTKIYEFKLYHEENLTAVNGSMDITFNTWTLNGTIKNNFSLSFSDNTTFGVCISPKWTEILVADAQMEYWASTYEQRTYFFDDVNITNTTQTINLYLVTESESDGITITIKDEAGLGVKNAFVKVQRYYINGSVYKTVTITKSDSEGIAYTYMIMYDAWYKFIVERGGTVLYEFPPMLIKDTEFTLSMPTAVGAEWFDYYGRIAFSCTENNVTGLIRCTVTDTSGLVHDVCLRVMEKNPVTETEHCYECASYSSATTLSCTVGNMSTKIFHYTLFVKLDDWVTLVSKYLDFRTGMWTTFGNEGVIASAIMVGTVPMIGIWNPVVAIVIGLSTLGIMSMIGFLHLEMGALMGIAIVGVILIWRMKS